MKVIDLIIALQKLPPNLDAMLDATGEGEMFYFKEIVDVEEIETALGDKMVVLSSFLGLPTEEN